MTKKLHLQCLLALQHIWLSNSVMDIQPLLEFCISWSRQELLAHCVCFVLATKPCLFAVSLACVSLTGLPAPLDTLLRLCLEPSIYKLHTSLAPAVATLHVYLDPGHVSAKANIFFYCSLGHITCLFATCTPIATWSIMLGSCTITAIPTSYSCKPLSCSWYHCVPLVMQVSS